MQEQTEELVRKESIMKKLQNVEEALQDALHRISVLENRWKTKLLTIENRERIKIELEELKEVVRKSEEILRSLRKKNTKSFMVAGSMIFACFLLYGLYLMIFGESIF